MTPHPFRQRMKALEVACDQREFLMSAPAFELALTRTGREGYLDAGLIIGGRACQRRVRICANKVVAGVRSSTLLLNIRPQDTRQFTSAQRFDQLEGLAVAIPWGFESPLPHLNERRSHESKGIPHRRTPIDRRHPTMASSSRVDRDHTVSAISRTILSCRSSCRSTGAAASRTSRSFDMSPSA